MSGVEDQPPPVPRPDLRPVWEMVLDDLDDLNRNRLLMCNGVAVVGLVRGDMQERDRVGRDRYGTPLTAHNGRDNLVDLYQELLDACAYARAHIARSVPGSLLLVRMYHQLIQNVVSVRAMIRDFSEETKP